MAAASVLLALPSTAGGAPRPDLQVRAVSTPSPQEAPGSRMTATATVRNAGAAPARASRLGFYLSRDRRKGRGDVRLEPRARVGARRPRTRARLLRTLTVPARAPTGSFLLLACADDTRRIRESRERNNCRAAERRIRIVRRTVFLPPAITPPAATPPRSSFTTPSITLTGPPDGTATLDSTPSYSGTAASASFAIARVEAQVDGGSFSTTGVTCSGCGTPSTTWTFSPPPLADGPHSFAFRAIDAAGRSSPTLTRALTVDTTPPIFSAITAAPGSTSVTASFSEPLSCPTVNPFDFSALVHGAAATVESVTCGASGATITLVLSAAPAAGQTVVVTLTGLVSDLAGNFAPRPTMHSDAA